MVHARNKGAQWERDCVKWFQDQGWPLARRAVTPAEDQDLGDIVGIPRVSVDCKNQAKPRVTDWMRQLDGIAHRSSPDVAVLLVKRPRSADMQRAFVVADELGFREWLDGLGVSRPVPWKTRKLMFRNWGNALALAAAQSKGELPAVNFTAGVNQRVLTLTDLGFFTRLLTEGGYLLRDQKD